MAIVSSADVRIGHCLDVNITSLSSEGEGVARFGGLVIFIPEALTGDQVSVQIVQRKKTFARGEILHILSPSPYRVTPICPVFKHCGGCSWQHIDYGHQLEAKVANLQAQLKRIGKIDIKPDPISPSPQPFNYRNRIQLQRGPFGVGYFQRRSHKIVPITECPIARPEINKLIAHIPPAKDEKTERIEVYISQKDLKARWQPIGPERSPEGFSQVNTEQNINLTNRIAHFIRRHLATHQMTTVLDLYGGAGNFTFNLHSQLPHIEFHVVELSVQSIKIGEFLAGHLPTHRIHFHHMAVEEFFVKAAGAIDWSEALAIVDPPRAGLSATTRHALLSALPSVIVYVSCNPSTLARDLDTLTNGETSYRLIAVEPFDMFPQTPHLEAMAILQQQ